MSRLTMSESLSVWEDLRKQACRLENEIDLKLVSLSKLNTNYNSFINYDAPQRDRAAAPSKSNAGHLVDNMILDIEQSLAKLMQVNEKLSDFARLSASSSAASSTPLHTIQRHWDILQDYSHEFRKIKANISTCRERDDLFETINRDNSQKVQTPGDLYLKEHEHLLSSDRLIDEQISIAMATRENLQSQKSALQQVGDKLTALGNRFPLVNSLMQRINLRKRRDAIIVGLVTAICLILLLWYAIVY